MKCLKCGKEFTEFEGEEEDFMCYECLDKEDNMNEYSVKHDIKNTADKEVEKMKKLPGTLNETREECLEKAVWTMNARIADLEITVEALREIARDYISPNDPGDECGILRPESE